MIGKCRFDSHSLRQPPDFVREPTIMDYFVLDSALWPRRLRGAIMQDAHPIVAQAQNAIMRSVRPDTLGTKGRLWREADLHTPDV
jgi:hypothetical protein